MKIWEAIRHPSKIIYVYGIRGGFRFLNDEAYLKLLYRCSIGKRLNLNNPQTFNEKIQWLKLHDRKPEYTTMVDKYEVKKYIAEKIGKEYVIPTLGAWNRFEEIDFDALPDQFVLKCTHDSGGLVIVRDKAKLDKAAAKKKIEKSLKRNYYWAGREWPYKNVKPRIIAEKYMENSSGNGLVDYKFFCFGGEPRIVYVSEDISSTPKTDFFDMSFNHLPIRMRDPNSVELPEKPEQFEEMQRVARILSKGHAHLRVDFYQVEKKIYVGELTFYHCSGMTPVKPEEWNIRMGSWIDIP